MALRPRNKKGKRPASPVESGGEGWIVDAKNPDGTPYVTVFASEADAREYAKSMGRKVRRRKKTGK
jgi:hypothetical protein